MNTNTRKSTAARLFRRALTIRLLAFGLLTGGLRAQTFTTQTVDSNGVAGFYTSQAIVNGDPPRRHSPSLMATSATPVRQCVSAYGLDIAGLVP
jgi:hypothetical protein